MTAVVLIVSSPPNLVRLSGSHRPHVAAQRRPPPYWTVRPGDTLEQISADTGVSVALLQAYNPNINPEALVPGDRLNLWRYPPKPKPRPPGPMFWSVRPGQSFGSIAASTGINIASLEQLNPKLKPAGLQPGERVRLRQ
ncbi:MAG TPA: LysM peptidoglycan-binding domain-containing protein [Solirubrobacteraceae bacterium]|nr:LysM peptidoglycan-binding domain-containing protein [Solirubrobacteraceae bacterium]